MSYDFLQGPDEHDDGTYLPFQRPRAYGCNNCRHMIDFGNVLYMSAFVADSFTMGYVCMNCTDGKTLFETRFQIDRQAMKRLLGSLRPHLPYRAAPGPYLSLSDEDEKRLKVAAFDLDGVVGVDDFLLYVDGPGSHRSDTGSDK